MKGDAILRIVFDAVLLASVIFGWWYIYIPLGLICLWMFPYYAELIVLGLFHDMLYGIGSAPWYLSFIGLLFAAAATVAFSILKLVVRWK